MLLTLVNITTFLTWLFSLLLGVFTLFRNPKHKVNRLWFFLSMVVVLWTTGYLLITLNKDYNYGLSCFYITYTGAILIPVLFYHFVSVFLYKNKAKKYVTMSGYISAFVLLMLLYFTNLILKGVQFIPWFGYNEDLGKLFILFIIHLYFFAISAMYLLYKSYKTNEGILKKQSLYILIAGIISFAGGTSNFITDIFHVFPYGQMIIFLYPIIITYAIFLKKY